MTWRFVNPVMLSAPFTGAVVALSVVFGAVVLGPAETAAYDGYRSMRASPEHQRFLERQHMERQFMSDHFARDRMYRRHNHRRQQDREMDYYLDAIRRDAQGRDHIGRQPMIIAPPRY